MKTYKLLLMLVSVFAVINFSFASNFKDTQGHKYEKSIDYLYEHGIIKGYDDGTFKPDREISRAEILKIIIKSSKGDKFDLITNCFPDVQTQWFAPYVCYAKANKIVKGYNDGTFKPNKQVTNAEGLKMALESFGMPIDKNISGPWYQPYIEFVHNNNIFSKYGIRAEGKMTRGAMAYLTHQLMLNKEGKLKFDNIRDIKSPGCGKIPPSTPPSSSIVDGKVRHYITVVGKNYDKNKPTKLIFAFHGRTNSNSMVRTYFKVEEASKGNAIIVYPLGLPEEGPSRNWRDNGDPSDDMRDFHLFDQLVEEFENNYCINKDQIFVVGHSLGSWFTNTLACARGDVIRATASVGGSTTYNNCKGPVAGIIMHNPEDRLAPFAGGIQARDQMLAQNSCGPETISVGPSEGHCVQYTNCQPGSTVIWCPHTDSTAYNGKYYPHTWPNFAGQFIRDFFNQQK